MFLKIISVFSWNKIPENGDLWCVVTVDGPNVIVDISELTIS